MTLAWETQLPHMEKLVLLALADNANDAGDCWPSINALATKCSLSRRSVLRTISGLQGGGHLTRRAEKGKVSAYRVHPCLLVTSVTQTPVTNSHQCQIDTSDRHDTDPCLLVTSPPLSPPPYNPPPLKPPSENRHEPPTRARARVRTVKAKAASEEPPPSNLNVEAWHRWEQYRRETRKPIKPASVLAAQRKLAGYGADQGAVVEQSIANGWQGLFDVKASQAAGTAEPIRRWRPSDDEDSHAVE